LLDILMPTGIFEQIIGNRIADQILQAYSPAYQSDAVSVVANPEPSTAILVLSAAGALLVFRHGKKID
jgi:hypothetical protein